MKTGDLDAFTLPPFSAENDLSGVDYGPWGCCALKFLLEHAQCAKGIFDGLTFTDGLRFGEMA
jgi:hypothetical protein